MMIVCSTEGVYEIDKKATFIILSHLKFCISLNNKLWTNIMKKCNKYEVWIMIYEKKCNVRFPKMTQYNTIKSVFKFMNY